MKKFIEYAKKMMIAILAIIAFLVLGKIGQEINEADKRYHEGQKQMIEEHKEWLEESRTQDQYIIFFDPPIEQVQATEKLDYG